MKPSAQHLSFAQLTELAEAQLPEAGRSGSSTGLPDGVQSHLAACTQCRAALDGIMRMLAALRGDDLLAPPPFLTDRVLRLFRATERSETLSAASVPAPLDRGLAAALRSLVAVLRFDSGLAPAYGMRSSQAENRQLFFSVDEYDIDVRLAPQAGAWRVEGQLLGGDAGGTAELAGTEHRYTGEMNELGEFAFGDVASGSYRLLLALPGVEIAVPELTLLSWRDKPGDKAILDG